jgi:hypothetical protein|tara:strand:- start:6337 stop:6663 length:327 start_codon:yes stop_codon:yes gene_type:complete
MSQYTDKINKIAEDFASIDNYEKLNALEGRDGMLIMHYNHGGKKIEFRIDSEYENASGKAGETIIVPATDAYYLSLKSQYESETWGHKIGKWWKKIKGVQAPKNIFGD